MSKRGPGNHERIVIVAERNPIFHDSRFAPWRSPNLGPRLDRHQPIQLRGMAGSRRPLLYLAIVIAVGAFLAIPAILNLVTNAILQTLFPVPGSFFTVKGRRMHLYCTGQGSPTVVLDAGGGNDWLIWQRVQPELAKRIRVCSYDRAGTGWSELQPGVRDAKNIADELHLLLKQAGEHEPLVLVGASVAGFYAREYVDRYPTEVAGLVLVDSSTPEQIREIPGSTYSHELIKRKHREVCWNGGGRPVDGHF